MSVEALNKTEQRPIGSSSLLSHKKYPQALVQITNKHNLIESQELRPDSHFSVYPKNM